MCEKDTECVCVCERNMKRHTEQKRKTFFIDGKNAKERETKHKA